MEEEDIPEDRNIMNGPKGVLEGLSGVLTLSTLQAFSIPLLQQLQPLAI